MKKVTVMMKKKPVMAKKSGNFAFAKVTKVKKAK